MGKFPPCFRVFMETCRHNPDFNWLIVTDDTAVFDSIPQNVSILHMTLQQVEARIRKKIGEWAVLPSPYKLCDYKPAYGLIFEEYLIGYTHWGYGDLDVVYGDLRKFVTDELLTQYDKIYLLGHLSILKNNEACKHAFQIETGNSNSYEAVYSSPGAFYFDEYNGINEKMLKAGMKVYMGIDFVDASSGGYSRLRLIDRRIFDIVMPGSLLCQCTFPRNYPTQGFIWDNGELYRVFLQGKEIGKDEFAYMHFRKKLAVFASDCDTRWMIGKKQIAPLPGAVDRKTINRYNRQTIPDSLCISQFSLKRKIKKAAYEIKWWAAAQLYRVAPLRTAVRKVKALHGNTK